jgi:hypothetical protein
VQLVQSNGTLHIMQGKSCRWAAPMRTFPSVLSGRTNGVPGHMPVRGCSGHTYSKKVESCSLQPGAMDHEAHVASAVNNRLTPLATCFLEVMELLAPLLKHKGYGQGYPTLFMHSAACRTCSFGSPVRR